MFKGSTVVYPDYSIHINIDTSNDYNYIILIAPININWEGATNTSSICIMYKCLVCSYEICVRFVFISIVFSPLNPPTAGHGPFFNRGS